MKISETAALFFVEVEIIVFTLCSIFVPSGELHDTLMALGYLLIAITICARQLSRF